MCKIDDNFKPCKVMVKFNNPATLKAIARKLIKKPWKFKWIKTVGFYYVLKYKNVYIVVDHEALDDARALGFTPAIEGIACEDVLENC